MLVFVLDNLHCAGTSGIRHARLGNETPKLKTLKDQHTR